MCECGCAGSRHFQRKLDIKGHPYIYAVSLHPGCDDCMTGPALLVERFTRSEARDFDIQHLARIKFDDRGQFWIPAIEPDMLLKALGSESDIGGLDGFDDVSTDGDIARALLSAVRATGEKYKEALHGE